MNFAVKFPDILKELIVVDIIPKTYPIHHDHILEGLEAIELQTITNRGEADQILSSFVPESDVRQFLLKNLTRTTDGGFAWKINIAAIDKNIEAIGKGMVIDGAYSGRTLFIRGSRSNYYKPGDELLVKSIFPNASWAILDTGHWVQAEKPTEFATLVLNHLKH